MPRWSSASPRAKTRVANADVPFETPGPVERTERLFVPSPSMIYLIFNEGYSASRRHRRDPQRRFAEEAIRLARLLLRLFQSEPEIMGLTALLLLQHARAAARFDADGAHWCCSTTRIVRLWKSQDDHRRTWR